MFSILAAVNPAEARGVFELLVVLIGVTKWPALVIAAGAALIAYNQHRDKQEGSATAALMIAGGAFLWFLVGLPA